ncbi:MAG TPA: menaquinone biosynthesis protein [Blastocatellia bacterium]|nr:menaquinone biosynthesis protein [Blastocatellia bacterium]
MDKPVIAGSTYLNSAPLCYSFLRGAQRPLCHFVPNTSPATCAALLRDGEVDAALIPAIEYQRMEGIALVPGVAVAAHREVRSVFLASFKPLEEIETVALDISSRTSAALTRIFFQYFLGRQVRYLPWNPDLDEMLRVADGALLIGDPALSVRFRRQELRFYDYASLWYEFTGLPLVFALWAVRRDRWQKLQAISFERARREGVEHIPEIIRAAVNELKLPADYLRSYFAQCVVYDLDAQKQAGLDRFYELAFELKLIPDRKELMFLPRS